VKGYNGVTSFAFRYGSVRLTCQLPDGQTETIIPPEVVHLPGSFNIISQFQIVDRHLKVEQVDHYGLNLYNRHRVLIARTPQVDGLLVPDRFLDRESTEHTDIDDSCLLALNTTGDASWHDVEKRMLRHRRLPHIGLKALEILPKVFADSGKMTGKCHCESCIKSKSARELFTPNTTSCTTEPLHLVHSDICDPLIHRHWRKSTYAALHPTRHEAYG